MATDVEIERALNAVNVTLNDQRLDRLDVGRLQRIVTLALGGERHLHVAEDAGEAGVAVMRDDGGETVGRIELSQGGRWTVHRCVPARSHGYVPTPG